MIFEGSYYPTDRLNPSAKTPEEAKENPSGLDYSCKYCKKYGICFRDHTDDIFVVTPCSICAMNNGGVWGWEKNEDGTYEKIKTNGMLPGNDGITDVILSHMTNPPRREYEPLMEEIILGYVQHALYCHLKWEDIMDFKEGASKDHGRTSNSFYRLGKGDVWHWWKLISLGSVISSPHWDGDSDIFTSKLPKRFCKVLKEILSIVKTYDRNESWDEFWKTEVEPVDVAIIYNYVMKKVLDRHVDRNKYYDTGFPERAYKCEDYGVIDYVRADFKLMEEPDTIPYCERGIAWIFDHVDPEYYGNPTFPLCDPRDVAEHFYVNYFKDVDGRFRHVQEVLEIHEHDIFGTSLNMIIHETHVWFIDINVCEIVPFSYDISSIMNQRWNGIKDYLSEALLFDVSIEKYIHHSVLCKLTYQPLNINASREYYTTSDYTSEYNFRVNFETSDNIWTIPNPVYQIVDMSEIETVNINIPGIEYEVDDDENELSGEKNKKIRDHLMGFQMIIEEDVKDHVNEGTYLKIMDKLKDVYTELN